MSAISPPQNAIFISFDDGFIKYAIACINSIVSNYPAHPKLLLNYSGENEYFREQLTLIDNSALISIDNTQVLEEVNLGIINNKQAFMRLFLWSNQFDHYDNILYLDADTIILKPLDELFNQDDFYVMADTSHSWVSEWVFTRKYYGDPRLKWALHSDGLELDSMQKRMCNSGVFVIPKKYRTPTHFNKLWEIEKKYRRFLAIGDQSIISIWCALNNIPLQNSYHNNLQFASLVYFSDNFPSADIININEQKNVNIFHFNAKKPSSSYYADLKSRFDIFSRYFYKYQYYLTHSALGGLNTDLICLNDLCLLIFIDENSKENDLTSLLQQISNHYMDYSLVICDQAKNDRLDLEGQESIRYLNVSNMENSFSKIANYVFKCISSEKIIALNKFNFPKKEFVTKSIEKLSYEQPLLVEQANLNTQVKIENQRICFSVFKPGFFELGGFNVNMSVFYTALVEFLVRKQLLFESSNMGIEGTKMILGNGGRLDDDLDEILKIEKMDIIELKRYAINGFKE